MFVIYLGCYDFIWLRIRVKSSGVDFIRNKKWRLGGVVKLLFGFFVDVVVGKDL